MGGVQIRAVVASGVFLTITACSGAGKPSPAPGPAAQPVPVAAPAITTPAPAELSAQVRTTRAACSTEATRQQFEVIDFITFNRLDENNWDTTIRARRKGKLVRIGCRYDLRAGWTYVYEPPAADGGNPWGPAGAPKAAGVAMSAQNAATAAAAVPAPPVPSASGAVPSTPTTSSVAASKAVPAKVSPAKVTPPRNEAKPSPKAEPAPKSVPGAHINLAAVTDTSARTAIARTRDACLAEAQRRKIAFDDFDAFRRVEGGQWEAMLLIKKGKVSQRSCRLDLVSGKATIK